MRVGSKFGTSEISNQHKITTIMQTWLRPCATKLGRVSRRRPVCVRKPITYQKFFVWGIPSHTYPTLTEKHPHVYHVYLCRPSMLHFIGEIVSFHLRQVDLITISQHLLPSPVLALVLSSTMCTRPHRKLLVTAHVRVWQSSWGTSMTMRAQETCECLLR